MKVTHSLSAVKASKSAMLITPSPLKSSHAVKLVFGMKQEAVDIFYRLLEWWDADKEFIIRNDDTHLFGSIGDEFKKRFANLTRLLKHVVISRLSPQTSIKEDLSRLLKELLGYGVPCVTIHAASIGIFPEQRLDVFGKIELAILSKQADC